MSSSAPKLCSKMTEFSQCSTTADLQIANCSSLQMGAIENSLYGCLCKASEQSLACYALCNDSPDMVLQASIRRNDVSSACSFAAALSTSTSTTSSTFSSTLQSSSSMKSTTFAFTTLSTGDSSSTANDRPSMVTATSKPSPTTKTTRPPAPPQVFLSDSINAFGPSFLMAAISMLLC